MSREHWQVLSTDFPYRHRMFRLRRDRLLLPNGVCATFTYVTKRPAVFILPITPQGDLVLIRQYRYIADAWLWEIPAGGSHDFAGSDWDDLVRRELWEEIGGRAAEIRPLGPFYGATGLLRQRFYAYLALGVTLEPDNHPEATEEIEVHSYPIPQALARLREGPTDALDGYVALKYEPLLLKLAETLP